MTRVRTHEVTRDGKTYTRQQHTRATGAPQTPQWFQPRRAWRNAKRSHWSLRNSKRGAAAMFATAATLEVLGFVVFKGAGALLIVVGLGCALLGYGMKDRT